MSVSPTGILSTPLDKLADLVASSATFQTWTGTASEAAAKAKVYRTARDASGSSAWGRPFALATIPRNWRLAWERGAFPSGIMFLMFEDAVASGNQAVHEDAAYAFTNNVGAVIGEMMVNSQQAGRLIVDSIEVEFEAQRSSKDEKDDYYQMGFRINYGLRG